MNRDYAETHPLPPLNFPNPKKINGFVSDPVQIFQPNNAKQSLKHRHAL